MRADIYYILEGKEVVKCNDKIAWERWMKNQGFMGISNKIIKQTTVGKIFISSIFSGIDHGYLRTSSPLVFEAMIFNGYLKKGFKGFIYSTYEETVNHHDRLVAKAKKLLRYKGLRQAKRELYKLRYRAN